jgi:quercetin dioxygenase-like cupin family protein
MTQESQHYVVAAHESQAIWFIGCLATIPATSEQTGGKLAVVEFTHSPGFATPQHVHHGADEAFYVLAGAMRGYCGEQRWRATTGSFVWLPRGVPHGYAVEGDETLRTLAIALPAGFDHFVIEAGVPAKERHLPPPGPIDTEKLLAAGDRHEIETLGPPIV